MPTKRDIKEEVTKLRHRIGAIQGPRAFVTFPDRTPGAPKTGRIAHGPKKPIRAKTEPQMRKKIIKKFKVKEGTPTVIVNVNPSTEEELAELKQQRQRDAEAARKEGKPAP